MSEKILVVDGGGRGHALADLFERDGAEVFVAPGNGGSPNIAIDQEGPIGANDFERLAGFALKNGIDLTIPSQDEQLAKGIVNYFQERDLPIFGPTRKAATLESSKATGKYVSGVLGMPVPESIPFNDYQRALRHLGRQAVYPMVIKADELFDGKGAVICVNQEMAEVKLYELMRIGTSGRTAQKVNFEEYLYGPEVSLLGLIGRGAYQMWPALQDHKPRYDNSEYPMTGGMGVVGPVLNMEQTRELGEKFIAPIAESWGVPFDGFLFPGIKLTPQGPKKLEDNVRPGDPEMQIYARLLKSSLLEAIKAAMNGELEHHQMAWSNQFAASISLVAAGYPGDYRKGDVIEGVEDAEQIDGVKVFHGGSGWENGNLVTNGGRVLHVTATDPTLKGAVKNAYSAADKIHFDGKGCRGKIGEQALSGAIEHAL